MHRGLLASYNPLAATRDGPESYLVHLTLHYGSRKSGGLLKYSVRDGKAMVHAHAMATGISIWRHR